MSRLGGEQGGVVVGGGGNTVFRLCKGLRPVSSRGSVWNVVTTGQRARCAASAARVMALAKCALTTMSYPPAGMTRTSRGLAPRLSSRSIPPTERAVRPAGRYCSNTPGWRPPSRTWSLGSPGLPGSPTSTSRS